MDKVTCKVALRRNRVVIGRKGRRDVSVKGTDG